jgi:D-serine deaminase-like pyridoxal phosphate-dependent protein
MAHAQHPEQTGIQLAMTDPDRLIAASAGFTTPLAVVDGITRERNLARMQKLAGDHGLRLRPHAKTHKSTRVAARQLAMGAVGLTVATLHEAEVFSTAGADDILVAHPPVGAVKVTRIAALADRARRLAVAVDSIEAVAALPASIEVLWEVDTGLHRIGTAPGQPTANAVRQLVDRIGPERFRGLITHGGHSYRSADDSALLQASSEEAHGLLASKELLEASGIAVRELSIGSTPTTRHIEVAGGITEMRPGTYVYGDANQVQLGSQQLEDCALAVIATVVSKPEATRVVVDSGSKILSADLRVPGVTGFGIVLGHREVTVERLSEEHAVLVSEAPIELAIGDRVAIVPTHACTTVNLNSAVLVVTDGGAEWETVDARGWQ